MQRDVVRLRGNRLTGFIEYYYTTRLTNNASAHLYGNKTVDEIREIYDTIRFGKVNVIIVDGLDDICDTGCKKLTSNCSSQARVRQDRSVAGKYGFEIGKKYPSSEILRMLGLEQDW